jgi:hypothetical protein
MLSSRDPENGENVDPSRKLPPQVLDGFADIDRWANEYFRGRFGQEAVGVNVPLVRFFFFVFPSFRNLSSSCLLRKSCSPF